MKLKLLLTICLLLITSQVFAKKITLYDCPTMADARSCNNCKKLSYMNIKVNANKVLMQYISNDSGESITNDYLQTVKHKDLQVRRFTGELVLSRREETLNVFDEDNWEFLYHWQNTFTDSMETKTASRTEKSMVNGKYYEFHDGDFGQSYRCGK